MKGLIAYILTVFISHANATCSQTDLLSGSQSVSNFPYSQLQPTPSSSECSDSDRDNLLHGLLNWAYDATLSQPLGLCTSYTDQECVCLSEAGAAIAGAVPSLCVAAITTTDLETYWPYVSFNYHLSCTVAETFSVCGTTFIPIHGGYSAWSSWSSCGACVSGDTDGTEVRTRTCTNPTPANPGNLTCIEGGLGDASESVTCSCPIDGGYTEWGAWGSCGPCSSSDIDGTQDRTRTCTNPTTAHGGSTCIVQGLGDASETTNCTCPETTTMEITTTTTAATAAPSTSSGISLTIIAAAAIGGLVIIAAIVALIILICLYKKKKSSSGFTLLVEEKKVGHDDVVVVPSGEKGVIVSKAPENFTYTKKIKAVHFVDENKAKPKPVFEKKQEPIKAKKQKKVTEKKKEEVVTKEKETKKEETLENIEEYRTETVELEQEKKKEEPVKVEEEVTKEPETIEEPAITEEKVNDRTIISLPRPSHGTEDTEELILSVNPVNYNNAIYNGDANAFMNARNFKNGPMPFKLAPQKLQSKDNLPRFVQKVMDKADQKAAVTQPQGKMLSGSLSQPGAGPSKLFKTPVSQPGGVIQPGGRPHALPKAGSVQLGQATIKKHDPSDSAQTGTSEQDGQIETGNKNVGRYTPAPNSHLKAAKKEPSLGHRYYTFHLNDEEDEFTAVAQ